MTIYQSFVLLGLGMIIMCLYAIAKGMDGIADLLRQIRNKIDGSAE